MATMTAKLSWRRTALIVFTALLLILILIMLTRNLSIIASTEPDMAEYVQTSTALQKQVQAGQSLQLAMRTDKPCYAFSDSLPASLEVLNVSDKPIVFMKTFGFLRANLLYGALPLVNQADDSLLVPAAAPREQDFVTLLPHESFVTTVPNFWELLRLPAERRKLSKGIYHLSVEYYNGSRGTVKETGASVLSVSVRFDDRMAWTGLLKSNTVAVEIVDDPDSCPF